MSHYAYKVEKMGPYQVDPMKHVKLAMSIARWYHCRHLTREDIQQEAMAALCAAARTYDSSREATFATWATAIIRWHLQGVMDTYRRVGTVGSSTRRCLPKAFRKHIREGGSTNPEVVRPLLVSRFNGWLEPTDWDCFVAVDALTRHELSLDMTPHANGDSIDSHTPLADRIEDPRLLEETTRTVETENLHRVIDRVLSEMTPREREVALRRVLEFLDDPPMLQEIADEWGVTRQRVQQIEAQAKTLLAQKLVSEL